MVVNGSLATAHFVGLFTTKSLVTHMVDICWGLKSHSVAPKPKMTQRIELHKKWNTWAYNKEKRW